MNNMLIRLGLKTCALLLSLFISFGSAARTVVLMDKDGTINNDHAENSTWITTWILQRIDRPRNVLQISKSKLPKTVKISYREYRRFASKLGRGAGLINDTHEYQLDFDPLHPERNLNFRPGYYAVNDDLTFKHYRSPEDGGRGYLLRDYRAARARTALLNADGGDHDWRGPAFPLVRHVLSTKETAPNLIIFSARGQAHSEWRRLLLEFKQDGLVSFVPPKLRVYSMSEPESLQFGRVGIGNKKAAVMEAVAKELLSSTDDHHSELVPDATPSSFGEERLGHTLIVGEDDPRYVVSLRKRMESLSSDLYLTHKVKFVLFNAGLDHEVAEAYWPWRYTVIDKGMGRPALPSEIANWTGTCTTLLR